MRNGRATFWVVRPFVFLISDLAPQRALRYLAWLHMADWRAALPWGIPLIQDRAVDEREGIDGDKAKTRSGDGFGHGFPYGLDGA